MTDTSDSQRQKVALVATAHYPVRVMLALLRYGITWQENPARAAIRRGLAWQEDPRG